MMERVILSLMGYAELMGMLYVGASVIDRSKVLTKIAERVNPPPPEQKDAK
jgi:hypothetical protein